MSYEKYKYLGFLGLLSLIGLKGFVTHNYLWFILFINYFCIDIRRINNNNGDGSQTIPKFIYALYISSRNTISFALIRMLFIWRTHSI